MTYYKTLIAVACTAFVGFGLRLQEAADPVTVFFVRHAETGPRPERQLSNAGKTRAAALRGLLHRSGVTHIFSTDFARTRGTVEPLAQATGVKVKLVAQDKQAAAIRALPPGSIAVVAGHSNTLPPLIERLGAKVTGLTRRGLIVDDVHDRLFVMTRGDKVSMVELRYGASSASGVEVRPAAKVKAENVQIGAARNERKSSAVFFYSRTSNSFDVHGQFELTYGSPTWKAEYGEALKSAEKGDRFRLGNNFFATFDTSCAVDVGGGRLSPGTYYLVLERGGPGEISLVFLDPKTIRSKKWNANHSSQTQGGVLSAMKWNQVDVSAERLSIAIQPAAKRGTQATVTISFGEHELTGTVRAVFD